MTRDLFANGAISEVSTWAVDQANLCARGVINRLCKRVDLEVVAAATGLADTHLRQAIDMKPGRNLDLQHHLKALRVATDAERLAWLTEVSAALGYRPTPIKPRTAEERLSDLEYRVGTELGLPGMALVERERSKP